MHFDWTDELIQFTPDALLVVKNNESIVWCNQKVFDIFGYQSDELVGQSIELLIPSEARDKHKNYSEVYINNPSNRRMGKGAGLAACTKSGKKVPVDIALSHFCREDEVWIFVAVRDISCQLEQEKKLEEIDDLLKQSQSIAGVGTWDWNIKKNSLKWSDEIFNIFGVKPQAFKENYEAFLVYVHQDDRNGISNAVEEAINERKKYHIEHRIIRPDGVVRYVVEDAKVFYDDDDKPVRMLGTVCDITSEKNRQKRLLLSQTVFDNCSEGIIITDSNLKILEVNPVVCKIFGMPRSDLVNKYADSLVHPDSPNTRQDIKKFLFTDNHWQGELWGKSLFRKIIPTLTSIVGVCDEKGDAKPSSYVITLTDISDLKKGEKKLKYLAHYDQLTELPNRTLYLDELGRRICVAEENNSELAVVYVDLDGFKLVNDSQGHDVGDKLLKEVAGILSTFGHDDIFSSRLGGDEFAMIISGETASYKLEGLVDDLVRRLNLTKEFPDYNLEISVSVGLSRFRIDGTERMDLLRKADQAMYQAKSKGKNNYSFYDKKLGDEVIRGLRLVSEMRKGIESNQFELHYQPQLCLKSGKVIGVEALLRWYHPEEGLIPPFEFIPLAESSGLINPIGNIAMSNACEMIKRLGLSSVKVAINLSAKQLHNPTLIDDIRRVLNFTGIHAKQLEVEITESVAMDDVEANLEILCRIKELGVFISIDDFGTGYSSLSYLKQFPVDMLKIDRSFIADLNRVGNDHSIVSAIISMAHNLGLLVIAEGVETEEQLNVLRATHCDQVQGYLLSRPVEEQFLADAIAELEDSQLVVS